MNKIVLLILSLLLLSCGASKPKSQPKKTVSTVKKPLVKKIVVKSVESSPKTETVVITNTDSTPKTEILEATQKVKVTTEMVLAYISQFAPTAKSNMTKNGIPASITLAQGILESGAGTGDLSVQANNHFGIKCHKEWTGASVKHDDDSLQECFRKYEHAEESYRDHSFFLTSRKHYASLFLLPKNDYKAWAKGLKAAGYATDVKYPDKLITLIEKYQLQQYDAEVLGTNFAVKPTIETNISNIEKGDYIVVKGDTLYSISKKFNITIDDLKQKNNIIDNALSLGQNLNVK